MHWEVESAIEFLDWLGRLQTVQWIIGLVITSGTGILSLLLNAPLWAIFAIMMAGALVTLGATIALQNIKRLPSIDGHEPKSKNVHPSDEAAYGPAYTTINYPRNALISERIGLRRSLDTRARVLDQALGKV